jgi:hypothetical protein
VLLQRSISDSFLSSFVVRSKYIVGSVFAVQILQGVKNDGQDFNIACCLIGFLICRD